MKKLRFIYLAVFSSLLLSGCFADQGNYDYKTLSTVTVSGIAESYTSVQYLDTIKIEPTIVLSEPTDDVTYMWTVAKYQDLVNEDENLKIDTISNEPSLNLYNEFVEGNYRLMFTVKNNTNGGIEVFSQTKLISKTEFSEGFYVMKETAEGNTELDMFSSDGGAIDNILEQTGNEPLVGKPESFTLLKEFTYLDAESGTYISDNMFVPITDEGNVGIFKIKDFTIFREYEDMFFGDAPTAKPKKIMQLFATIFACITEDGLYFTRNDKSRPSLGYFGYKQAYDSGFDYEINDQICYTGYNAFWVDETVNCVRAINFNTGAIGQAKTLMSSYPSIVNMPGEFVHMDCLGYKLANVANIMNEDGVYKLYNITFMSTSSYNAHPVTRTDIPASSAIYNAKMFAGNKNTATLLYFNDENDNVYAFNTADVSTKQLTLAGLPAGEEITLMQNMFCTLGQYPFDHFVVATTDGTNYTVSMYNMVGGEPVGEPVKTFKGKGIVRKMQYVCPEVIYTSGGTYNISLHY